MQQVRLHPVAVIGNMEAPPVTTLASLAFDETLRTFDAKSIAGAMVVEGGALWCPSLRWTHEKGAETSSLARIV